MVGAGETARTVAKALKARGIAFIGPTLAQAFLLQVLGCR